jgi:hypothetical protein
MATRDLQRPFELVLEMDTALGNQIKNVQNSEPLAVGQVLGLNEKHINSYPNMTQRTDHSTDMYNCHGLTFGARRAKIWEPSEVRKILREDGYSIVSAQRALPGDIVVYIDRTSGDISHSGIVVSGITDPSDPLETPRVVSKWGYWTEVIHFAHQCPYVGADVEIEYHRCLLGRIQ